MQKVTIVMYHYVRELKKTRYPEIKGLELKYFMDQLDYFHQKYTFVRMEQCIEALNGSYNGFPENALLLTFDDGYLEHYTEVFPILDERGIQGCFFPPVQSTLENKVLDVNKIHFILASSEKPKELLNHLSKKIKDCQKDFDLEEPQEYYNRIESSEHPYDPIEIIIFKRVLQRELPLEARAKIISDMFEQFVGVSEEVFSNELYMNEDQLKLMRNKGMFIGGHGYSHEWLNSLDEQEQKSEVHLTDDFLGTLGVEKDCRVMCYPYGAYNEITIKQLKGKGYAAGLTTVPRKATLINENRFTLSRLDTNEFAVW